MVQGRKFSLKAVYQALPKQEIRELASLALQRGQTPEEVVDELVAIVDDAVDWKALFPKAPDAVTSTLELVDAPLIRALVLLIVKGVAAALPKPA